jgi:hypothetical protein
MTIGGDQRRLAVKNVLIMNDDFEQKLQRQELRPVPRNWREEILQTARAAGPRPSTPAPRRSWLSTLNHQLSTLLWPCPQAWAGLAAAWLVIVVVNLAGGDESSRTVARQSAPPPPQLIETVREQRRELARLIEPSMASDADRPKSLSPRPRSSWRGELLNA